MKAPPLKCFVILVLPLSSHSFIPKAANHHRKTRPNAMPRFALTERQMQFWEDVEDGLTEIESCFRKHEGQSLERIRKFAER
jgi:hypothetical protein